MQELLAYKTTEISITGFHSIKNASFKRIYEAYLSSYLKQKHGAFCVVVKLIKFQTVKICFHFAFTNCWNCPNREFIGTFFRCY